jgi:hypothetical protein
MARILFRDGSREEPDMKVGRWVSIVVAGAFVMAGGSTAVMGTAQVAHAQCGDADGDGVCDGDDNCAQPNPDQADGDADGIGDACSVDVTIASFADDGAARFAADVRTTSPSGAPLAGTIAVHSGGVSALRFDWLATSCRDPQDTLDLLVNDVVVARVEPEAGGPLCICTPAIGGYEVPLGRALTLLQPGINLLGVRKSTGFPVETRTLMAWASATITVDGVPTVVPLFDHLGLNEFGPRDLCGNRSTGRVVDGGEFTADLAAPALEMSWQGTLPCEVALADVPTGPFSLVVMASDGDTWDAAAASGTIATASSVTLGGACDDGNPCTIDTCGAGGCQHTPVVCDGGGDACNAGATCDPATGQCVGAPSPDGTACDDGNACTDGDVCQAGACTSAPKRNGASCDDGNACTRKDTCEAGACVGRRPVVCPGEAQCREASACEPSTGRCTTPERKPDGTACHDGNECTRTDTCRAGTCVGTDPILCAPPDACHTAICKPRSGRCKVKRVKPYHRCQWNERDKRDKGRWW